MQNTLAYLPKGQPGKQIIGRTIVDLRETQLNKVVSEYIDFMVSHTGKPLKEIKIAELLSRVDAYLITNAPNLNPASFRAELGKASNRAYYGE